jgi:hypothetical protein
MFEMAMTSNSAYIHEPIGLKRGDEFTGGNATREVQTLTTTAGDSTEVMRASA